MVDRINVLLDRTAFPPIRDLASERRRLDLFRVVVGAIAVVRTTFILDSSRFYFDPPDCTLGMCSGESWFALAEVLLLIAFTLGFFTPVTTLLLVATYVEFDERLLSSTLGTEVLMTLLLVFLLSGAGTTLSLDSWIVRHRPRSLLAGALRRAYGVLGLATASQIRLYLVLGFLAYGVVSISALLFHQDDAFWQTGNTVGVMLTNSYLSRLYEPLRDLEAASPDLFHALSATAVALQGVFQLLMIPLIRWAWGYRFVVVYGLFFFLTSMVALQISYLPYMELCLWAVLFTRARAEPVIAVLYDDGCGICRRTARALAALDAYNTYDLVPLSRAGALLERHGIGREAERELYGISDGNAVSGYAFYEAAARRNPVLWPLVPLLFMGRVLRVGPAIYSAVAHRRKRACDIHPPLLGPGIEDSARDQAARVGQFVTVAALVTYAAFLITRPQVQDLSDHMVGLDPGSIPGIEKLRNPLLHAGLNQPNIFNDTDLGMANQWPVIRERLSDGDTRLVPLSDEDGSRLSYHRSDTIYFGNAIHWRRAMIDEDLKAEHQPGEYGYALLYKLATYDYRRRGTDGPATYEIELLTAPSTNLHLDREKRYEPTLAYSYEVTIDE